MYAKSGSTIPRGRGLGKYPDQACYDPNRPAWLPNWIDSATEIGCDWNLLVFGNKSGVPQPGTFQTVTNPDGTQSVVAVADPAAVQNAMATCAARAGTWDPTLQACTPGLIAQLSGYLPWLVVGLAAFMLIPAIAGGRR